MFTIHLVSMELLKQNPLKSNLRKLSAICGAHSTQSSPAPHAKGKGGATTLGRERGY